jgi:uncharacterized protein YuzE
MKIRYFSDTDTALIEFANVPVVETREISENLYIDLDEKGNLVSMTMQKKKRVCRKYLLCRWKKQPPNKSLNTDAHYAPLHSHGLAPTLCANNK